MNFLQLVFWIPLTLYRTAILGVQMGAQGVRDINWAIAISGGVLFPLWMVYSLYHVAGCLIWDSRFTALLTDVYGWYYWPARAFAVLLLVPLGWAIFYSAPREQFRLMFAHLDPFGKSAWSTLSKHTAIRTASRLVLVGYVAIYYLGPFSVAEIAKALEDQANKVFYAMTPEGYHFYKTPGFDVKYGTKLERAPIDIQKLAEVMKNEPGVFPDPNAQANFDLLTGGPKVWYAVAQSGAYELFGAPGLHPKLGIPLLPFTSKAVMLYEKWRKETEEREAAEKAAAERRAFEKAETDLRERYFDYSAPAARQMTAGVIVLALADDLPCEATKDVASRLDGFLKLEGKRLERGLFKPAFLQSDLFPLLEMGNGAVLERLRLKNVNGGCLAGRTRVETKAGAGGQPASATATLALVRLGPDGKHLASHRWSESASGATTREAGIAALDRALARAQTEGGLFAKPPTLSVRPEPVEGSPPAPVEAPPRKRKR